MDGREEAEERKGVLGVSGTLVEADDSWLLCGVYVGVGCIDYVQLDAMTFLFGSTNA